MLLDFTRGIWQKWVIKLAGAAPPDPCLLLKVSVCSVRSERCRSDLTVQTLTFQKRGRPPALAAAQPRPPSNWPSSWLPFASRSAHQLEEGRLWAQHHLVRLILLQHKRVSCKELEACLGLLMWATSISSHLRCFTAPIYSDLRSPPGTCYPVPPRSWSQFLWCLDASCKIVRDASCLQLPLQARVIEVRGKSVPKPTYGPYQPPTRRSGSASQTPRPWKSHCAMKAKPPYIGSPNVCFGFFFPVCFVTHESWLMPIAS